MATTEWLNSELNKLIEESSSLHMRNVALLKKAIEEFEKKYGIKECHFIPYEHFNVYLGYDSPIDVTISRLYWTDSKHIFIESVNVDDYNHIIDDSISSYDDYYFELIDVLILQLKNGRYTPE